MYKKILILLALPLILAACAKSTNSSSCSYAPLTAVALPSEVDSLKNYLDKNNIDYTQHPGGFFYHIDTQGSGTVPTVCSAVTVKYRGRVINSSTPFDQNTSGITFTLGQLIAGWQLGIPLIQKGGAIKLYIPPSLAYGNSPQTGIPANSYLVFDIELINVQQ